MLLVQLVVALLAGCVVAWFLGTDWFPTVSAAVDRLPMQGAIKSGQLDWSVQSPQSLAESRYLAFAVDLNHAGQARSPSHIQVEFGRTDIRLYSLFGRLQAPYPKDYVVAFNFQELKPWWGAWEPVFLAVAAMGCAFGLLLAWAVLATVYCLPAWLLGLYLNRELSFCGSWRLAGAALMPGALVMTAAIGVYGLGGLDVIRLIAAAVLHLALGWLYLILGALAVPKIQGELDPKVNPFTNAPVGQAPAGEQSQKFEPSNPFRASRD
jgi:hypothetical protein